MSRHRCPECGRQVGLHGNGLARHRIPQTTTTCRGTGTRVAPGPDVLSLLVAERFGAPRLTPPPPAVPVRLPEPAEGPWLPPPGQPVDIGPDVRRLRGLGWSTQQIAAVLEVPESAVQRAAA